MSRYWRTENEDGTYTEKKVYYDEDIDSFAEWCGDRFRYSDTLKCWINKQGLPVSKFTTAQLREIWEEWKLAQQKGEE